MTVTYLRSRRELEEFCQEAREGGRLGLDTEFHREKRFFPKLALVQLSVPGREVLVDPLREMDLAPLDDVVTDPSIVKILHAASQDCEIFYLRSRKPPRNVFDTQVAAAMLGMGAQISLAGLVDSLVGVRLKKGATFTDWLKRPLTPRQETYAIADVEHLLPMHDEMVRRLDAKGRMEWLREECRRFENSDLYEIPDDSLFRRVKRFASLDPRGLAVLNELAKWREKEARQRDKPRRSIVGDEVLLEIARSTPQSIKELGGTRGLYPREVQRSGKAMLAAIQSGLEIPEDQCPVLRKSRPPGRDVELSATFVQSFLKVCCGGQEIDPSLIASSSDIEAVVHGYVQGDLNPERGPAMLRGWRNELVGSKVLAFLEGKIALRLDPETTRPVLEDVP